MKKKFKSKNIIYKRLISFTLVVALLVSGVPMDMISDEIKEKTGIEMTVQAAAEVPQTQLDKYSANSYTFTTNNTYTSDGVTYSFAEYSQCFQDETWAADHANDTITLNPANGTFIFDSTYNPIGNTASGCAFNGTIILNTSLNEFAVQASTPIFECVKDTVTIERLLQAGETTRANIPININRVADVSSTEVSPLFAKHVVGSGDGNSHEWKITLSADSAHSYSGVIYEMTDSANINLTFTDNSTHTPGTDANGNIVSGSIIANNQDHTSYGILCGKVLNNSSLQAAYTNTKNDKVTFIGTDTAYCGGLIGEINNSTFELLSGSSDVKVEFKKAKEQVGFIFGHAEDSTITLPSDYSVSGTIEGTKYAGGIAGYCTNTDITYPTDGAITLADCTIKGGSEATGGVFGYYSASDITKDILLSRSYNLSGTTVSNGTGITGGIAGIYEPKYSDDVSIAVGNYTFGSNVKLSGSVSGGLFGKYIANGNVTITGTVSVPESNTHHGGIIGTYDNSVLSRTLYLNNLTVNTVKQTENEKGLGGVIENVTGSSYIKVDGLTVNVTGGANLSNTTNKFGGIVGRLGDSASNGSFIDVVGDFTLTTSTSYNGGGIAGSFKNGVLRLAGTTDLSGAQTSGGYGQLIYENDTTLVYAKGNGSDTDWTFNRNASTAASDFGQWGEVVRLVDGNKNLESVSIVSVDETAHTVTIAAPVTTLSDKASFAKLALNMQLNDGDTHGALLFADTTNKKSVLLTQTITISDDITLSGTGMTGLMRDNLSTDIFKGKIVGGSKKITLATGEVYGTGNANGGKIYLSYGNSSNGHNAQGLLAYSQSAEVSNLTVDGTMNINRPGIGDSLYAGAVSGYVTGGISLNSVTVEPTINFNSTKSDKNVYIGGVAGIYDGSTDATGFTVNASIVTPAINISGNNALTTAHCYGGVLGYLNGSNATAYDFTIENNSTLTPKIAIDSATTQQSEAYIGGMIAVAGSGKQQTITINNTEIKNADISTKSQYAGGLLGERWENVNVSIDGLTVTGSKVDNSYSGEANNGGLVFASYGIWDVKSVSIDEDCAFTTTSGNTFGLLVNEGYRSKNGLYLKVKNSGLDYAAGITVTQAKYMDEICVKSADSADRVLSGGDNAGVISIDMNTGTGTSTKVTETGTYQNKIDAFADRKPNSLSRYYYGLQLMKDNASASGGEQFLLWSVRKYAASNIKNNFKANDDMITATDINLSGLSYYPVAGGEVTLPSNATVTFGFSDVKTAEDTAAFDTDSYQRYPDDTGDNRNQHYLMQTGLFTTTSKLTATGLTLSGDFGYIEGIASGALINDSTSGSISLTSLTLDGLVPSDDDSYLLVNYINGTGTATPSLTVTTLRAQGFGASSNIDLPVAKSLFGKATGQNMTITFSDIQLDARTPRLSGVNYSGLTAEQSADLDTALTSAYGTNRSIFSTATFFTTLQAAKTCDMKYDYAVEADWGYKDDKDPSKGYKRYVTYGKEVTDSREYVNAEKRYLLAGETDGHFTNPISDSNTEFNFTVGFLPYVGNYTEKGNYSDYPVVEIKVNYKAPGLTEGCGTYNDPYIITTADQLVIIANAINNGSFPSTITLPNISKGNYTAATWHDDTYGHSVYTLSGSNYTKASDGKKNDGTWNTTKVRYYLASAYYKIDGSFTLPSDFEGIGKPNATNWGSVETKGNFTFHGVIVGDSTSKPTITNPSNNPLIVVANGAVVKNINIVASGDITRSQDATGDMALYGYGISHSNTKKENAVYYGGVIGEIMGGDNIIDDVTVTYQGTTTLSGTYAHVIAEGGMVGTVVNGALIFRGSNSVSDRSVSGGGIYSAEYVGRVINGYAVYEKIADKTGSAPNNGSADYTYHIDTIDRSNTNKLDVNWDSSTITVPDAQSLYIMSLITQSIAGTAATSRNQDYGALSPSYGHNSYITGIARLGDYTNVGCGDDKATGDYPDYNNYAYRDSINNYYSSQGDLTRSPTPYIIYRYTKAYGTDSWTSKNYPARKMTYDNTKFWDITLDKNDTFEDFDDFQAFRGIGSVGIISKTVTDSSGNNAKAAMKIATFDGGGNTINLHISLPRYGRDNENYFHKQNKSLTQSYSGEILDSNAYGQDGQLWKLMGLGLFDSVMVYYEKEDHEYQFKNFTLQGSIRDKVYDSEYTDITGTTNQTQLFCVGGVVGKRINGNNYNLNFKDIIFDGFNITGAYNCGGLIGLDAFGKTGRINGTDTNLKQMKIEGCNSTRNGISVIGGFYGKDATATDAFRHGIGAFVGMTFWCRPVIDGRTATSDFSNIIVDKVTTFYDEETYGCNVGGLIGYTGTGAEIKNIKLVGANENSVIGASNVNNAAGFIGFAQTKGNGDNSGWDDDPNYAANSIYMENCTLYHLSVRAKRSAAGLFGRSWNSAWSPKYIYINNCAVIGEKDKHEIRAYGSSNDNVYDCVGGLISGCESASTQITGVIQNSYVEGYTIEGRNVGGIIGRVSYKPVYLKNLYVKNCDIISYSDNVGGLVGWSNQDLSGYNLEIDNVNFYSWTYNHSGTKTDKTSKSGALVGWDNGNKTYKFIGIGLYHADASKIPSKLFYNNGTQNTNFFVYADYTHASSNDMPVTTKVGDVTTTTYPDSYASTFNDSANVDQPLAPFLTVNPRMGMGTSEYITGDGAAIGKAGSIYADAVASSKSNRAYTVNSTNATDNSQDQSATNKDSVILAKYINNDGSYTSGVFRISTASAEFGDDFTELMEDNNSVQDFAMLVINDDSDKAADITPFIKSYIRLVTNAAGSANQYRFNQAAYSCGNDNIDKLYTINISPCYYDKDAGKFVLGTSGQQGLQLYAKTDTTNLGKYYFDSNKADSASDNPYQFSLIDVQFKDPTDSSKIAYHLYVPVYTKKMITAEFKAVSMSETKYYRSPYASLISSEITAGKTDSNPSQLVESTDEWTTTFIRFTYPKNQITSNDDWNYNKSITITIDSNFQSLPEGSKFILLDPNANADKFYTYELGSAWASGEHILNFSDFVVNGSDPVEYFSPQNLSDILADESASSENELYEDYYISMYVPKAGDGYTHNMTIGCGSEMSCTVGTDTYKANIDSILYSRVVLGDLFIHKITSFDVKSGDGETYGDSKGMTETNKVLKTDVTATVQIKNANAGSYLANSNVYHAFFISLTSHKEDQSVSDIIYGITPGYISNEITYSISGGTENTVTDSYLGANYIMLKTGDIIRTLYSNSTPEVTIHSVTTMTFNDITAFPYNIEEKDSIGTQVSIKSSLAYREEDLLYSALNVPKEDPDGYFYYSKTRNNAELSFNAVPTDDTTDEIGYKTNNRSLLGVNGKYGTSHPVIGKAMYNVDDIIDYDSAKQVKYTVELLKKVTDVNGNTGYVPISNISDYISDVNMVDESGEVILTLEADESDAGKYVYTGDINHNSALDKDKMFEATFNCNVLTGDTTHNEYANYKIYITAQLIGSTNTWKDAYLIYTNAKFDPSVIDETN